MDCKEIVECCKEFKFVGFSILFIGGLYLIVTSLSSYRYPLQSLSPFDLSPKADITVRKKSGSKGHIQYVEVAKTSLA